MYATISDLFWDALFDAAAALFSAVRRLLLAMEA